MTIAYRVTQLLVGNHVEVNLPATFPQGQEIEIIVLPLKSNNVATDRLIMREWLARAWGSAPDFPDRPAQPLLDDLPEL